MDIEAIILSPPLSLSLLFILAIFLNGYLKIPLNLLFLLGYGLVMYMIYFLRFHEPKKLKRLLKNVKKYKLDIGLVTLLLFFAFTTYLYPFFMDEVPKGWDVWHHHATIKSVIKNQGLPKYDALGEMVNAPFTYPPGFSLFVYFIYLITRMDLITILKMIPILSSMSLVLFTYFLVRMFYSWKTAAFSSFFVFLTGSGFETIWPFPMGIAISLIPLLTYTYFKSLNNKKFYVIASLITALMGLLHPLSIISFGFGCLTFILWLLIKRDLKSIKKFVIIFLFSGFLLILLHYGPLLIEYGLPCNRAPIMISIPIKITRLIACVGPLIFILYLIGIFTPKKLRIEIFFISWSFILLFLWMLDNTSFLPSFKPHTIIGNLSRVISNYISIPISIIAAITFFKYWDVFFKKNKYLLFLLTVFIIAFMLFDTFYEFKLFDSHVRSIKSRINMPQFISGDFFYENLILKQIIPRDSIVLSDPRNSVIVKSIGDRDVVGTYDMFSSYYDCSIRERTKDMCKFFTGNDNDRVEIINVYNISYFVEYYDSKTFLDLFGGCHKELTVNQSSILNPIFMDKFFTVYELKV